MEVSEALAITDSGPSIGTYRDQDIREWIDLAGQRFNYDRIALEDNDGGSPLAQLRDDEFLIAPGLIYRRT